MFSKKFSCGFTLQKVNRERKDEKNKENARGSIKNPRVLSLCFKLFLLLKI